MPSPRAHTPLILQLLLPPLLALLAGCTAPAPAPPPPPPTAAPQVGSCTLEIDGGSAGGGADDEAQIRAVLRAESELMVSQQIDPLMALWADAGRVVNAKNTPADESDDQLWMGEDAVRHRYVRTVFPGAPQAAAPADMEIVIGGENGDSAVVTSTTHIGSELSQAGDRWQLQKIAGCWVIERLVYNLEPAQ